MPIRTLLIAALFAPAILAAEPLPGTQRLTAQGDPASQMVEGIDRFLLRETDNFVKHRASFWKRDLSSSEAYETSVAPNRARLVKMLGVIDPRVLFDAPELLATTKQNALVAHGAGFDAYAVRWPVIGQIHGEGLLLVPTGKAAVADILALPDADQTPEMIAGLTDDVEKQSQFARRLAECGCRVLIPALVDRSDTYSLPPSGQRTNQPHREYVYRPAFEMGRHIIGYEVQKVLAGVDWFTRDAEDRKPRIGVIGYGEGGLLALYAAALDPRIQVTCVSGYFGSRQDLWQEPIYRNLFGLLPEFGDAEIASLIAPRALIIETSGGPKVSGPPAPRDKRSGAAPGRIISPASSGEEVKRATVLAGALSRVKQVVAGNDSDGNFGSSQALRPFTAALGITLNADVDIRSLKRERDVDSASRLKRQIDQMQAFTQDLVRASDATRRAYWSRADRSSADQWKQTTALYRDEFARDAMGRIDQSLLPPNARSRQIYDEPTYRGYEVMLDVFPDVFAYGILLVPKNIPPGERRPVVVCQHGLEGRPTDVADPQNDNPHYHRFACNLTERGFITFAPQNPYIGGEKFRTLVRKANPLGLSLWSFIVPQHQQTVDWLASLPMVDAQRIAFYGLSYGGKTAMRVPALVERYCLSICSGDFNEWIWKCTSLDFRAGYPGTNEYDMFEWNLGNTFNYAEMANLIAPRPFMVERGHRDGVAIDEWVAYEYAKVRRTYADLKAPQNTTIEFFDGPHMIHGVGTFKFLHEHLQWPEPAEAKP